MKKKILFFLPGSTGGAERMTITIAKMLPLDQYDVKFVVIGKLRSIYNFIPEGYAVDCIPIRNRYCFATLRIALKILCERADLAFCSHVIFNHRVILAAKLTRTSVIVRSSGMPSQYGESFVSHIKSFYRLADAVIAQQEQMQQDFIHVLGVDPLKTIILHNPIDTEVIDAEANVPSPYPIADQINFCHVGRVKKVKGQDICISALEKVKAKIPNAHLYLVGTYNKEDEYYQSLRNLVQEYCLEDNVHFVGFDTNPYRWMRYCNCFVFPSRREGLPNALIEASYLQRPCVASRCLDIISRIIQDGRNGYVVPVADVESTAKAMEQAIHLNDCRMLYGPAKRKDFLQLFASVLNKQKNIK